MFCTKCGAEIFDGAKFCTVCGNIIENKESETEKIDRLVDEMNKEKPVNDILNDLLSEVKKQPEIYATYKTQLPQENTKIPFDSFQKPKQEQEEWLNEEAIQEIWNFPRQNNIIHETENKMRQSRTQDDLLPDGTPDWLDEIKQEEEDEIYRSKFHLMEHPLILTSIVAFLMLIISIISIFIIWNV